MGRYAKWVGKDLANLLSLSLRELEELYPHLTTDNLRTSKRNWQKKLKDGNVSEHLQNTPEQEQEKEPRLVEAERRISELETQLRLALRQRDKNKDKITEYVAAMQAAIGELYADIQLNPPSPKRIDRRTTGQPQTAIIGLADWQLGKRTTSYNSEICENRIENFAQSCLQIAHNQNKLSRVKDVHIFVLGDIVEGEGIFPSQAHQLDSSLYRQVAVDGPRILGNFIGEMTNFFKNVHVTAVIGNHGNLKMKGEVNPETNMDRMLYKATEQMYKNSPEITFNIPDGDGERNFYAVEKIDDWGFLLVHGDQIRGGFAGFPFYGAAKKTWGWIDSIDEPFDYVFAGHWHTPTRLTLNHRRYYGMGSPESGNSYAQEQLAAVGHPTQYMGFVHPEHGLIQDHWVSLEKHESQLQKYRRLGGRAF